LYDLDYRFQVMDAYEDYRQVLTPIPGPHIHVQRDGASQGLGDLVRRNNQDMAETVSRHPDRFVGSAAATPIIDPEAATEEANHAVRELGALGVQLEEDAIEFPLHDHRVPYVR
jgi:aminocarboxymuconate-semialdehyde decarboxylase